MGQHYPRLEQNLGAIWDIHVLRSFDALAINALRSFDALAIWGHQRITFILMHWWFGAFTYYVQIGSSGDLEQTLCVHLEISTIHTYPWRAREAVRGSSFSEGNFWVKFSGDLETHSSAFMQGGKKEQYHVIWPKRIDTFHLVLEGGMFQMWRFTRHADGSGSEQFQWKMRGDIIERGGYF